jgi:hypothetical protein
MYAIIIIIIIYCCWQFSSFEAYAKQAVPVVLLASSTRGRKPYIFSLFFFSIAEFENDPNDWSKIPTMVMKGIGTIIWDEANNVRNQRLCWYCKKF